MIEFESSPSIPTAAARCGWPRLEDATKRTPHTLEEASPTSQTPRTTARARRRHEVRRLRERVVRACASTGWRPHAHLDDGNRRCGSCAIAIRTSAGWSLPRMRSDPLRNPLTAMPALRFALRPTGMPGVAAKPHPPRRDEALMAHWRLITPRLGRRSTRAGGQLYPGPSTTRRIADLERIGVSGVISNDRACSRSDRARRAV